MSRPCRDRFAFAQDAYRPGLTELAGVWLGARAAAVRVALADVLARIEAASHGRGRRRAEWHTPEAQLRPVSISISDGEAWVIVRALGAVCDPQGPGSAELFAAVAVLQAARSPADRLAAARVVRIAADIEVRRAELAAREPYRSPWKLRRAADRAARRAGSARTHASEGRLDPESA